MLEFFSDENVYKKDRLDLIINDINKIISEEDEIDSNTYSLEQINSTEFKRKFSKHKLLNKYFSPREINNVKGPQFGDLFSGAGGLGLGLENSGFNAKFIADSNKPALETYFFNRDIPIDNFYSGDIKNLIEKDNKLIQKMSDCFLISGGPPCQGFSMANRQPLLKDPRNELYKDFLLILDEVRPPFFLLENVKGMARKRKEVEDDLKKIIGNEYQYCFLMLNAKDYNIPQNRERFFIIGNRIGVNPENIALSIKSKATGTKFFLKHALEGLPAIKAGVEFKKPLLENDRVGYKIKRFDMPKTEFSSYINGDKKQKYLFNHKSRFNNDNDQEIFKRLPQGGDSHHQSIQDILKYKNRKDIFKDKYFKLLPDKVSKTITSHMKFDCHMYIHPTQARGLSPREAARIQTFPDDYLFMGRPNEWYQQIGNAVPVKLAEILGNEIIKYYK
jgi:DNA (cytosine-5)-methyltransferase 1